MVTREALVDSCSRTTGASWNQALPPAPPHLLGTPCAGRKKDFLRFECLFSFSTVNRSP